MHDHFRTTPPGIENTEDTQLLTLYFSKCSHSKGSTEQIVSDTKFCIGVISASGRHFGVRSHVVIYTLLHYGARHLGHSLQPLYQMEENPRLKGVDLPWDLSREEILKRSEALIESSRKVYDAVGALKPDDLNFVSCLKVTRRSKALKTLHGLFTSLSRGCNR